MTDETIYEAILLFYCIKLETVKKQVKANVINLFNITLQCNVELLIYNNKSALLCRVTSILTFSDNREERSLLTVSPATEKTLSEGADEAGTHK